VKTWAQRVQYVGRPISLIPHACVHFDSPHHDKSLFIEFLKELQDNDDAFTIGLGDVLDFTRTTWRKAFLQARLDTSLHKAVDLTVKGICDRYIKTVLEYCPDFSKKCLGYHSGNHKWDFATGVNCDQYICEKLDIPYLARMSFGRWVFQRNETSIGVRLALTILSHHGDRIGGNSAFTGATIDAMKRKSMGWDADIVLMAHNHKKGGYINQVMRLSHSKIPHLVEHNVVFMRVGCFLKSYPEDTDTSPYAEDKGSYADSAFYSPNSIGYGRIIIKWKYSSSAIHPRAPERLSLEIQT